MSHAVPRRLRQVLLKPASTQNGVALLVSLLIAILLAGTFLFRTDENSGGNFARDLATEAVMTQAKDALIGKAISERNNYFFGFLQVPDLGSTRGSSAEGNSSGNFSGNAKNLSVIGRLPWRSLGLAPLKDVNGECLWYAVSGVAQTGTPPDVFNWDSIGHFDIFTSDGTSAGTISTTGSNYHNRPLALVLSAGPPLTGQNRSLSPTDSVVECGGNYDTRNYLDSFTANTDINNIVNYFSLPANTNNATGDAATLAIPKNFIAGYVEVSVAGSKVRIANDRLLTITPKDIFDRVKKRSDFKIDVDTMINDYVTCLNAIPVASLPAASVGNKGIDNMITACPMPAGLKQKFSESWRDNLLYAGGPAGNFTVNGEANVCKAVLIFGGERTAGQSRATVAEKNLASSYLEGTNAASFPANGNYMSASPEFSPNAASTDIVRCITGLPPGATQISFAQNLGSFAATGATPTITTNASDSAVSISDNAAGPAGACFWSPIAIPLASKNLRAYYEFQFAFADTFATTGALGDRGNGMTLQLVRGDIPNAAGVFTQPNTCGTETNLGALGTSDSWGSLSYIFETDVRKDASGGDPAGNHSAIMKNGSLDHTLLGGTPTTACNGSTNSCLHTPLNSFEESPTPLLHNQRIEIHTGCNASCTLCDPSSTNTYAKINTWVDCVSCNDVVNDFVAAELIATTANRNFSAAGNWSGANWAIVSNTLQHTAGATAATLPNSALSTAPTVGKDYQLEIRLNTTNTGALTIAFGGTSTAALIPAIGSSTYRLQLRASSSAPLTITPNASWLGALSLVSIKPVSTPTTNLCTVFNTEMNKIFMGVTGGFLSGVNTLQGVTIKNLLLRTD